MKLKSIVVLLVFVVLAFFFYYYISYTFRPTNNPVAITNISPTDYGCKNCNIILISIDSLRSDHVGVYGYDKGTTSNIDKFASESILFKNYIAQAYLTPISEFSFQTSLYPDQTGEAVPNLYSQYYGLQNPPLMMAQILKVYNYSTIAITSSPEFYAHEDFKNGFDRFQYNGFDRFQYNGTIQYNSSRDLPNVNPELLSLSQSKNKKFFLWIAIGTVHSPYGMYAPNQTKEKYVDPSYNGFLKNYSLDLHDILSIYNYTFYPYYIDSELIQYRNFSQQSIKMNQNDMNYIIANYDSGIDYTDSYVGNLLKNITALGLDNDTIIIITSSHGEELGEHGYFMHYDGYEEEIHVPLIIKDPKLPPKVIDTQAQSIDILPTILDMLNLSQYEGAQGNSLIPVVLGKTNSTFNQYVFVERVPLFEEFEMLSNISAVHMDFAVRTNDWELIYRPNWEWEVNNSWYTYITGTKIQFPEFELYNIKQDPLELHNLYLDRPDIDITLKSQLFNFTNRVNEENLIFNRTQSNPTQIFPYP